MQIELLAPARNKEIGIAAINCGADSIYIAGPAFGAREAAGNTVKDIAELVLYAHKFGVSVYTVVNTIIYDNEIDSVQDLLWQLYDAGVDAFIIQDLGILKMRRPPVRLFASTQTFINNPEQAKFLESLGFERLILERQISLEQIRSIRNSVSCDLEFFVHGALCVSYSGQCYLSQSLTGRSANRGACAQACRSRYDLVDDSGKVIAKNKNILSLKDYKLDEYIPQLVEAGISSFKIEGRLKNDSYVKNVVRHYRNVIDNFLLAHPEHQKSSFGHIQGGFVPNISATFNRGYTECFIKGTKGHWNSGDSAKSLGEYIGEVASIRGNSITIDTNFVISNGDGLAFVCKDGSIIGSRVDVADGKNIQIKDTTNLYKGEKVYRNMNIKFEKELERNSPKRLLAVDVKYSSKDGRTSFYAKCENGAEAIISYDETAPVATNRERAFDSLKEQIGKVTEPYHFSISEIDTDKVFFYPASFLNSIRRQLAEELKLPVSNSYGDVKSSFDSLQSPAHLTYRANVSNTLAESLYREHGSLKIDKAYEISAPVEVEVMRTKYCIKYELGLCPKQYPARKYKEPFYLLNKDYKLKIGFDCKNCEMVVIL